MSCLGIWLRYEHQGEVCDHRRRLQHFLAGQRDTPDVQETPHRLHAANVQPILRARRGDQVKEIRGSRARPPGQVISTKLLLWAAFASAERILEKLLFSALIGSRSR